MLIKEKYFFSEDRSGRSSPIILSQSHIEKYWDLNEMNDYDEILKDFLETCNSGDEWVNGTELLKCVDYKL